MLKVRSRDSDRVGWTDGRVQGISGMVVGQTALRWQTAVD